MLYYTTETKIEDNNPHNIPLPVVKYKRGAVASSSQFNSEIVVDIFKKGGSVADATIVGLLCQGLSSPQSMGVGGGSLLLYYEKKKCKIHFLNSRECAPQATTTDMFQNKLDIPYGALSAGVPGELAGYWALHQKFGHLPWKELFQPAIKLCKEGITVTKATAETFKKMRRFILHSPTIKLIEICCDPNTGDVYKEGDRMTRPVLAETFSILAEEGVQAFYQGGLKHLFVKDIQENGGVINESDLMNYSIKWSTPISLLLPKNRTIYTVPSPGCGQTLLQILDTVFHMGPTHDPSINWFRIVESWKHAFGQRLDADGPKITEEPKETTYKPYGAKLAEQTIETDRKTSKDIRHYSTIFAKADNEGGTCSMCFLAPNGDAVCVTSSINYALGSFFASKSTGIILNNHMMDFSIPKFSDQFYNRNRLEPFKQPVSCMVPTITVDSKTGELITLIGAAGGFKILTSTSQFIIETQLYNIHQNVAMNHRRLHHQLIPMVLFYEDGFPKDILDALRKMEHHLEKIVPATSVAAISKQMGYILATGDPRRRGSANGY